MGRDSFFKLCSLLRDAVGDDEFRPEEHLDAYNNQVKGAVKRSGGIICGEVRVAIYVRILSGASYLDLMMIFDLTHRPIFESCHRVCAWIGRTFCYPLVEALEMENVEYFETVASHFAYSASDGMFRNCIGAVDGWAVRIKRPVANHKLRDPGAYYSRKGSLH